MTDCNQGFAHQLTRRTLLTFAAIIGVTPMLNAQTATDKSSPDWRLDSIYGGTYTSADFAGKPILLVNTASLCGYTPQFTALQKLYDTYKAQGLVVLAVPSDDFHQEKDDNEAVKDFCEITYGLNLPMTVISSVTGPQAVPLYKWLQDTAGFAPQWNFNKVLFDRSGRVIGTWRSDPEPLGGEIEAAVKRAL